MEVFAMIYELRVYQPVPGQMPKLLARFRDKLLPIWESDVRAHLLLEFVSTARQRRRPSQWQEIGGEYRQRRAPGTSKRPLRLESDPRPFRPQPRVRPQ